MAHQDKDQALPLLWLRLQLWCRVQSLAQEFLHAYGRAQEFLHAYGRALPSPIQKNLPQIR